MICTGGYFSSPAERWGFLFGCYSTTLYISVMKLSLLSVKEYADRRGVSKAAVTKALRENSGTMPGIHDYHIIGNSLVLHVDETKLIKVKKKEKG